jgi:hypothetical protein
MQHYKYICTLTFKQRGQWLPKIAPHCRRKGSASLAFKLLVKSCSRVTEQSYYKIVIRHTDILTKRFSN